jgi:hypothetical protein
MERGRLSVDGRQPIDPPFHPRHRGHQGFRVRMAGRPEDPLHGAALDESPRVHHGDAVAHPCDDPEVVGDEQHGETRPHLRLLSSVRYWSHRHVQRGGGLIGDEQSRLGGDGDGPTTRCFIPDI